MTTPAKLKLLKNLKKLLPKKAGSVTAVIIIFISIVIFYLEAIAPQPVPTGAALPATDPAQLYQVHHVVDGDTIAIVVGDQIVPVRLLGVDTPETVDPQRSAQCYGQEASAFTASHLEGKSIKVIADETQQNVDNYNRLLRYVELDNGQDFNGELISRGYGRVFRVRKAFERYDAYVNLESQAKTQQAGLWHPDTCDGRR